MTPNSQTTEAAALTDGHTPQQNTVGTAGAGEISCDTNEDLAGPVQSRVVATGHRSTRSPLRCGLSSARISSRQMNNLQSYVR